MSVLPPHDARLFKVHWLRVFCGLLLLLVLLAVVVWEKLYHEYPQKLSDADKFKYGSIGGESADGIPYWIWVVLPRVFPEYLPGPGGYASLGLVWEPGYELPIGFSKKRIGYERIAFNCAVCHTGSYRTRREDGRMTVTKPVVGGPAIRFNPQAYLAFLSACANDPRFNTDTLMAAIDYNTKMSLADKLLYRHFLIPGTKKAIQEQSADAAWMRTKPLWGPGRIDPFNPVKFDMLGMQPDGTVGNSDMMPLWELGAVNRPAFHTDGLSQNLLDCSLAGALGDGATRKSLPVGHIREIVDSFKLMKAPSLTAIAKSDGLLFKKGQTLFSQHCALCHEPGGKYTFRSIRQSDDESETIFEERPPTIATDRYRLEMWNAPNEDGRTPFEIYNDFGNGYPWDLNTFQKTDGYLALPLTGLLWRAPYLHNGSVPTLVDLLNEPMPTETVRNLMEQAQSGSYERLLKQFSMADGPSFLRSQIISGLAPIKPAVDRLIDGARLLQKRPPMFYRGSDELDLRHGGFAHTSDSLHPNSIAVPYITFIKGNSNAGHLYGTHLSDDEKRALIEYLKTL